MIRAAAAVVLGSDVYLNGVESLGVKRVYDRVNKIRSSKDSDEEVLEDLKQWACNEGMIRGKKYPVIDRDLFDTLVSAFVFEPAVIDTNNDNGDCSYNIKSSDSPYIHGVPPVSLPAYLKEFGIGFKRAMTK